MSTFLPFLLGLIAGILTAPAFVQWFILRTREPYKDCDEYMRTEYGYAKVEMSIDQLLQDLTSDRSIDD